MPPLLRRPVQLLGLFALILWAIGLWEKRRSFSSLDCYVLVFACIVLAWLWSDARFWLPLLPVLVGYVLMGAERIAPHCRLRPTIVVGVQILPLNGQHELRMKVPYRIVAIALALTGPLGVLFESIRRPGLFANTTYLGGILALEIVLACLWRFEVVFFPVTMLCFLSADTANPFAGESFTLRWFFLGAGALAGSIIWIKTNRTRYFSLFHLVALFCVLSAFASASASSSPVTASLKVASLFLLFLYASTGGRAAMVGRERSFVLLLVRACEILVFAASLLYFAGDNVFGNPNNLGAMIGVVATPLLLWAALVAENRNERQRRYIALGLCGILLYGTVCRAAIVADVMVAIVLTIGLRRPSFLLRAAFAGALFLEVMAVANPAHMADFMGSLTGRFIFKSMGERSNQGIFGSRETPWDQTLSAVKKHPWFGTGFGTSDLGTELPDFQSSMVYTKEVSNREHGSSYLALAEYMGLLGIVPFLALFLLLFRALFRTFAWMRMTGNSNHYSVPFALVIIAGLIHAGFEDWLFAAGSYLCVLFWVLAFLLIDVAPVIRGESRVSAAQSYGRYARAQSFQQPTL